MSWTIWETLARSSILRKIPIVCDSNLATRSSKVSARPKMSRSTRASSVESVFPNAPEYWMSVRRPARTGRTGIRATTAAFPVRKGWQNATNDALRPDRRRGAVSTGRTQGVLERIRTVRRTCWALTSCSSCRPSQATFTCSSDAPRMRHGSGGANSTMSDLSDPSNFR